MDSSSCSQKMGYQRISTRQKNRLIEMAAEDPRLLNKFWGPNYREDKKRLWQKVAEELNAIPGCVKDVKSWQRCLFDLKKNTNKTEAGKQKFPHLIKGYPLLSNEGDNGEHSRLAQLLMGKKLAEANDEVLLARLRQPAGYQRISTRQKNRLIEMAAEDSRLLIRFWGPSQKEDKKMLWQKVADELNAIPGCEKDPKSWQRCLIDLQKNTRKTEAGKQKYPHLIGGNPALSNEGDNDEQPTELVEDRSWVEDNYEVVSTRIPLFPPADVVSSPQAVWMVTDHLCGLGDKSCESPSLVDSAAEAAALAATINNARRKVRKFKKKRKEIEMANHFLISHKRIADACEALVEPVTRLANAMERVANQFIKSDNDVA